MMQNYVRELKAANATKDDFLSIFFHDLRSPLNAVIGFADLISKQSTNEEVKSDAHNIVQAGQQLEQLINDILDAYRMNSGKVEMKTTSLSLPEIVKRCNNLNKVAADNKHIQFVYDKPVASEQKSVNGNESALTRSINNLIEHFTPALSG